MKLIPFTQYLRPSGQPRGISVERPDGTANKARRLIDAGYAFECEVLTTGDVSLSVSDGESDIVGEIVPNGPEIPQAVDRLVDKATERVVGFEVL